MTISVDTSRGGVYDRHVSDDLATIEDCTDETVCEVRVFEGSNHVAATLSVVGGDSWRAVLALDEAGCDALVRALGYDVTDEDDTAAREEYRASQDTIGTALEYVRLKSELARAERMRDSYASDAQHWISVAGDLLRELADTRLALTPETCDRLADACRSGRGEQSISRNYAMARAALQSAADWLRRAEQDR